MSVSILTYHSQNISGDGHDDNDHVALREDIMALRRAGVPVVPLGHVLDWIDGEREDAGVNGAVVLTFDDGCDFDVLDLDYPGFGVQRSFLGIMQDQLEARPGYALHATSFVIASEQARKTIDAGSLFGRGWISHEWWRTVDAGGLIAVENHGWDHNHPDLPGDERGSFHSIETHPQCLQQVVQAGGFIEHITGRWPNYFAYPFGESSDYIRDEFFPGHPEVHGCRAALGTEEGKVTRATDRWNLPRFVCGRDWKTAEELLTLIA